MRNLRTQVFIGVLMISLAACGEQAEPIAEPEGLAHETSTPQYSAEAFYQTTTYGMASAGGFAFNDDGSGLLISSDQTGVFNAYRLSVDGADADAIPLTSSDDNAIFALSWFPADDRILYTYDSGGNELYHVVALELDGTSSDLTPGENHTAQFVRWHDDHQSFYITTTERNQRNFDLYRYSTDDYSRELVFENPGFAIAAISGDGRWLALDKPRTSADSDIYIVDLSSENPVPELITPHEGNIEYATFTIQSDKSASRIRNQ